MPEPVKLESTRRLYHFKRDLRLMRYLFPWRTTAGLLLAVASIAWAFNLAYNSVVQESLTYVQAVYAVLNMIFLQLSYTDVPPDLVLAPFFVLVPPVGLALFSLLGFNVLGLIRVFFVRRERGQRWQEAFTSTLSRHVVVLGLGSIGYRVAGSLAEFGFPVVGVELNQSEFAKELMDADVPVIIGDVSTYDALEKAGVDRAETVVVCTNSDVANIEAAFHVREMNPQAHLVLRMFDQEIAQLIGPKFEVDAVLSRSAIAAVAFAHAAVGVEVLESFALEGQSYVFARVPLYRGSPLLGRTVGDVAQDQVVTVVFVCRDRRMLSEPPSSTSLEVGDQLFLFTASDRLMALVRHSFSGENHRDEIELKDHIIVCGLGHVGYRIADTLSALGYEVLALDREAGRLGERLAQQGLMVRTADFRRQTVLREAGIAYARALVACSGDDMLNIETGLRTRELNPDLRIVSRVFDQDFGRCLTEKFGVDVVYSTSALAAPTFIQAALKMRLAQEVAIGDQVLSLARLTIEPASSLIDQVIEQLNAQDDLTVMLHARCDQIDVPPCPESRLHVGDQIVILASRSRLCHLIRLNHSESLASQMWI
jgi:Trk K+ transport system NAD-binding subunit